MNNKYVKPIHFAHLTEGKLDPDKRYWAESTYNDSYRIRLDDGSTTVQPKENFIKA